MSEQTVPPADSAIERLLNELRRRKVFRTAGAYLAGAFILLQVADLTFEPLGFSRGAYRALIIVCAIGFPAALALSWLYELRSAAVSDPPRVPLFASALLIVGATGLLGFWAARRWQSGEPAGEKAAAITGAARTLDPRSYEEYVRAKYHMRRTSPGTIDSAVALLERVVKRQPEFADGHAQLGLAYMYQYATYRSNVPALEEKALLASEKALSLDPNIPEAHVVRGRMLWTPNAGFAHEEAAAEYHAALAADPRNAEARLQLGQVYAHVGLLDEAIELHNEAARLNRLDPRPRTWAAQAMLYKGDVDQALQLLRTAPPGFDVTMVGHQMAFGLIRLSRLEEAEASLRRDLARSNDDAGVLTSTYAILLARRGDAAGVRRRIDEAAPRNRGSVHFHHTAYNIGVAHALLGHPDSAVLWLRRAVDTGFPCYPLYATDPHLTRLRSYPPFSTLLRELQRTQARYRKALL